MNTASKCSVVICKILPEATWSIITLIILALYYHLTTPQFSGFYQHRDTPTKIRFENEVRFWEKKSPILIEATLYQPHMYQALFKFVPDNCLLELTINEQRITSNLPVCDYSKGQIFDLRDYLHRGENSLRAVVRNDGGPGGLRIAPVYWDTIPLCLNLAALIIIAAGLVRVLRKFRLLHDPLTYIWLLGVAVRLFYFVITDRGERAHDADGHHAYILHVLNHFTIPAADSGWQLYQPPLYYFLVSVALLPFKLFGFTEDLLLNMAQFLSCALSCAALAAGVWIARLLWADTKEQFYPVAFCLTLAVLPGLVYPSSRVSNDTLMQLLSFLFLAFLLKWSQSGNIRSWYQAMTTLGLALITKGNALYFCGIAACALLFKSGRLVINREILAIAFKSAGIVLALSLWYWVYRFGFEGQKHLVGNIEGNHPSLYMPLSLDNFVRVDPVAIIQFPYTSSRDDMLGRTSMWEYLTKSAFTGEWNFGERVHAAMRAVHALNYFLFFPLALLALARDVLARKRVTLWATLLLSVVSMAGLIVLRPVGCLQDFRYLNIVAIPVTYYVLSGIKMLPGRLRIVSEVLFCAFLLLCLYGIVMIAGV